MVSDFEFRVSGLVIGVYILWSSCSDFGCSVVHGEGFGCGITLLFFFITLKS